ncbi:cation diffusion facilitator family transporter [Microaerobacter geothermalis]|uniref:cation diffusion facilitator family transporter n=1 Tax=Microaerobacter geothermalis TaxID=674972 RepID=UPI001F31D3CA|nr:cation diffusion facilitator family transporter [Microaerobacter geothermalis]MCF6092979.1 cation diffusion facilitator family transporter [Microaerobacter geothermalis]
MVNEREKISSKIAWISLWSNIFLTVSKLIIGLIAGSKALFADGIHSAADVVASLAVLFALRISDKPPDKEHPYGHGKVEVVSSGVVGGILFLVSVYVFIDAVIAFFKPVETPKMVAAYVALFSYILKETLYRYSLGLGEKLNSKALIAISLDHKADIIASLAAALGILVATGGEWLNLSFLLYGDIIASVIVSYFILKIAIHMIVEAFHILLERSVDEEMIRQYREIIMKHKEVKRIDKIRGREHGHYILLDLRISVDPSLSIKEGHDVGREIKLELMNRFDNIAEVLVHLNPYDVEW